VSLSLTGADLFPNTKEKDVRMPSRNSDMHSAEEQGTQSVGVDILRKPIKASQKVRLWRRQALS